MLSRIGQLSNFWFMFEMYRCERVGVSACLRVCVSAFDYVNMLNTNLSTHLTRLAQPQCNESTCLGGNGQGSLL